MIQLYKYIYCKAYWFCINVFREKDFPWFFASIAVSTLLVGTAVLALEILEYYMLPTRVNTYGQYHGYVALLSLAIIAVYSKANDRYLQIIKDCNNIPLKKRRVFRYVTIAYIAAVPIALVYFAYLIRTYSITD